MSKDIPTAGIISGDRYLSPLALNTNAARAASALHSVGVWQGDMVALLLRNDFVFFEASLGASLLGATPVALNWHMTPEEINYVLEDSDAKVIIAHADLLSEALLAVAVGREVIAVETPPEIATAYDIPAERCKVPGAIPEWYSWIGGHSTWEQQAMIPTQPMFYTSGTSGLPKGVKRKPVAPEVAQRASARSIKAWGLDRSGVVSVMTGPLYHSAPNAYGANILRNQGLLILQPRFSALGILELITRYRVTHLHMVPTMFVRLLKIDPATRNQFDISSLEYIAHGAAPCPSDVKKAMIDWWGPIIHEYYAMTETGIITACDSSQWLAHRGTVGSAVDGIEINILRDDDQFADLGEVGQICVRSETTPFVSYHRADLKTEELRRGDYIKTGDVGYLDADGFLFISDRLSDMVISGGVNIYPAEIEKILVNMPEVADCAVLGVPDPEFGERLVAIVAGSGAINADAIKAFLGKHLAGYKIPRDYHFDIPLPREDSGKIKKRLLRDLLISAQPHVANAS